MEEYGLPPEFDSRSMPRLAGAHMIDEQHSSRHSRLMHTHENALELLYIYSGHGEHIINGRLYRVQAGDMVICNAGVLHGEDPERARQMRSYSIALTGVKVRGLPEGCLIGESINPVISCGMLAEQIGPMMRLIFLLQSDQRNLRQVCQHTALAVLVLIWDFLQNRAERMHEKQHPASGILALRIQRYLDAHYREPLTLRSVSLALRVSEYYLAHVFKQEYGMPPMQYVLKRRIGEAQTLLMDTNLPVAEISEQLGYENPWNFSTAFRRKVGMSPSQYRTAFRTMKG